MRHNALPGGEQDPEQAQGTLGTGTPQAAFSPKDGQPEYNKDHIKHEYKSIIEADYEKH